MLTLLGSVTVTVAARLVALVVPNVPQAVAAATNRAAMLVVMPVNGLETVVSVTGKPPPTAPVVGESVPSPAAAKAGPAAPATTRTAAAVEAIPARRSRLPVLSWDLRMRGPPTVSTNRVVDW